MFKKHNGFQGPRELFNFDFIKTYIYQVCCKFERANTTTFAIIQTEKVSSIECERKYFVSIDVQSLVTRFSKIYYQKLPTAALPYLSL